MPFHEASSLITGVQRCSSLRKARQLHALMLTSATLVTNPSPSPFFYNNLLSMYAKCGSIEDAFKVFDKMPQRNLVSYNALIAAYSRLPLQALSSFQLLSTMTVQGIGPNNSTFSSLFQAASSLEDQSIGSALHGQVVKMGFMNDLWVQTSLLGMYSNCGDLECSKLVYDNMVEKDAVAWNSMIFGCMKNNDIKQGLQLFANMLRSGLMPTNFTYSMLLSACSRLGDYVNGKIIHAQLVKQNQPADLPLQNALLDMYSTCGDVETAFCVFRRIEVPDLVSWNSLLSGYSEDEDGEEAMFLFIKLCQTSSERPDDYTFAAIISATSYLPALDFGKPLHAQINKVGFESSVFVGSTLVSMYFKNNEYDSAQELFKSMVHKDVVIWTEMISGYTRLGEGEDAVKCFYQMQMEGLKADSFALSCVLSSCADLVTLKQGEMIHSLTVKSGYEEDMCVSGSLIDMYAKNGNLPAAQLVFCRVADPDLKCWNSMLGGYSNHGKAEASIKLFEEILNRNMKPDHVTFVSLLSACSHGGLAEEGRLFWNYMRENNLVPVPKHYSCMVSLLSRAGLLQEAEDLIKEAPYIEDMPELWRILLSSCVAYKNLRVGVHAAEEALRMDGEDGATLVLLSNLYAVSGRWDAVSEMRRKIRGMMLEKDPGVSWIEIMNKTHIFTSDDQTHPQVDDVQSELQRLQGNMISLEIHVIEDDTT